MNRLREWLRSSGLETTNHTYVEDARVSVLGRRYNVGRPVLLLLYPVTSCILDGLDPLRMVVLDIKLHRFGERASMINADMSKDGACRLSRGSMHLVWCG